MHLPRPHRPLLAGGVFWHALAHVANVFLTVAFC